MAVDIETGLWPRFSRFSLNFPDIWQPQCASSPTCWFSVGLNLNSGMTSQTHISGLTLKCKFILSATVNGSRFLSVTWRRCPWVGDWSWDAPAAPSAVQKNSCRCRLGSGAECPQWCSVEKPACWSWGGILPSVVQRTAPPLFPQHLKKQNSKTFLLKQRLSSSINKTHWPDSEVPVSVSDTLWSQLSWSGPRGSARPVWPSDCGDSTGDLAVKWPLLELLLSLPARLRPDSDLSIPLVEPDKEVVWDLLLGVRVSSSCTLRLLCSASSPDAISFRISVSNIQI